MGNLDIYVDLFKHNLVLPSIKDRPCKVDFVIGLVIFVLNLPNGQVLFFFGKFKLQKDCNEPC